jgi:hypothetical protein
MTNDPLRVLYPFIPMLRSRGIETLVDTLSPLRLQFPSQGVQLERLLRSQSLRFLYLPCFFTNENAWAVEGIKGDARAENIFSGHSSPSQIVTISLFHASW